MHDGSHDCSHDTCRTADGVQRFLIERDSNYYLFGGRQFSRSVLEMQQYIDISPYRDTSGNDTVSVHI